MTENPERKLNVLLKQSFNSVQQQTARFKVAKELMRSLKRDIQGLPKMSIIEERNDSNLYEFVVRRSTEATMDNYRSNAKQILRKSKLNTSFEQPTEQWSLEPKLKVVHRRATLKKLSVRFTNKQVAKTTIRRKSCHCSECGSDNTLIGRLQSKGAQQIRTQPYSIFLQQRRLFKESCLSFSMNILHKKIRSKRTNLGKLKSLSPTSLQSRLLKRHVSLNDSLPTVARKSLTQKEIVHNKQVPRVSMFLKRQQTQFISLTKLLKKNEEETTPIIPQTKILPITSLKMQQSNRRIVTELKKQSSTNFIPLSGTITKLLQKSPSQMSNNKSIDQQLRMQLKYHLQSLKSPLMKSSRQNTQTERRSPYKSQMLDFLLKVRQR